MPAVRHHRRACGGDVPEQVDLVDARRQGRHELARLVRVLRAVDDQLVRRVMLQIAPVAVGHPLPNQRAVRLVKLGPHVFGVDDLKLDWLPARHDRHFEHTASRSAVDDELPHVRERRLARVRIADELDHRVVGVRDLFEVLADLRHLRLHRARAVPLPLPDLLAALLQAQLLCDGVVAAGPAVDPERNLGQVVGRHVHAQVGGRLDEHGLEELVVVHRATVPPVQVSPVRHGCEGAGGVGLGLTPDPINQTFDSLKCHALALY